MNAPTAHKIRVQPSERDSSGSEETYANPMFFITKTDLASELRFRTSELDQDFGPGPLHQQDPKRCVLAYFVLPAMSVLYWTLIVPYRIAYDTSSGKYFKVIGSAFRKVLCGIVEVSIVLYYIGELRIIIRNTNGGAIGILYEITYLIFISFTISTFYTAWFRMEGFLNLFLQIDSLQHHFVSNGMNFARSKKTHAMKWILYLFHACVVIGYVVVLNGNDRIFLPLLENGLTTDSLYEIAKGTANVAVLSTSLLLGLDGQNWIERMPDWSIFAIAVVYECIEIVSGIGWVFMNLTILMWGFVFLNLLKSFLLKTKANRYLGGRVLEDIRDFNTITQIFDNFNEVMGLLNFFSVVAAILYISVTSGSMFLKSNEGSCVSTFVYISSFVPFILVLAVASEVNRMASEFPALLKRMFNHQNGACWAKGKDNQLEVLQGLAMVHHDIAINAVGFQGLGFFTISYSFIGTVISVIASYAVVALQLNTPATLSTPTPTPSPIPVA